MVNKGLRALRKKIRGKIVEHHILYEYDGCAHKQKEVKVPIFYIEHHIITQLQRRGKWVSKGFIKALKHFIWLYEDSAVDLSAVDGDTIEKVGG